MAISLLGKLATVVLVVGLVIAPAAEAAVTCGGVAGSLSGCIGYITTAVPAKTVPGGCCSGISKLNSMAKSPADRQLTCNCLKSFSGRISGVNYKTVEGLPSKCGVSVPYRISPSTDCSGVH